ncbi:MAG: hypothetical protein EP330_11310 [Deltaproteobacteria bacterium]|nr:MAG: hypothetical protein EP330_11310 [Deltaproteobacteria bacterium]
MRPIRPLALALLLACRPATTEEQPEDLTFAFSFAVIADPHISGAISHEERLATAVAWINAHAVERQIELVFVVGDIGWGEGLATSYALLSDLDVAWVPILGDNEVHFGDEENFDTVFTPQYEALAASHGLQRGQIEVDVEGQTLWLQNLHFEHRGLRWVGLDWVSRSEDNLLSELAELHDVPGGTLPFLSDLLLPLESTPAEDVLLFSHHPMHLGMFDLDEMQALTDVIGPVSGRVAGAYAGHAHIDAEVEVEDAGYTAWVTDATWDDEITVRMVDVWANRETHRYEQELVVLE